MLLLFCKEHRVCGVSRICRQWGQDLNYWMKNQMTVIMIIWWLHHITGCGVTLVQQWFVCAERGKLQSRASMTGQACCTRVTSNLTLISIFKPFHYSETTKLIQYVVNEATVLLLTLPQKNTCNLVRKYTGKTTKFKQYVHLHFRMNSHLTAYFTSYD